MSREVEMFNVTGFWWVFPWIQGTEEGSNSQKSHIATPERDRNESLVEYVSLGAEMFQNMTLKEPV